MAVGSNQLKLQFSETIVFAGSFLDQLPIDVKENGLQATAVTPTGDGTVYTLTLSRAVSTGDLDFFFASVSTTVSDAAGNSAESVTVSPFAIVSATYVDDNNDRTIDRIRVVVQPGHVAFTASNGFT